MLRPFIPLLPALSALALPCGASSHAAPAPLTLERGDSARPVEAFPAAGTLVIDFTPPHAIHPSGATVGTAPGASVIPVVGAPLFDAAIRSDPAAVTLALTLRRAAPLPPIDDRLARISWSRLESGKAYQLAFVWDIARNRFDVWLNGILQETVTEIAIPFWESGPPPANGVIRLGDAMSRARLHSRPLDESEIAGLARASDIPPLAGEGRTLHTAPLAVRTAPPLFESDFSGPLRLEAESALFDGDRRVREPEADWILEGEGRAFTRNGRLVLETGRHTPPSRWENDAPLWENPSHLVLWLNRRLPDGIVIDYDLEVDDPEVGLHLLFFSAVRPGGGSIFEPGLSKREAKFDRYIRNPGEFLSYHFSLWASPYALPRRSSNLRKNGRFLLLSAGDDRIQPAGRGPHRIRVLKAGPRLAAEVNGVTVIDHVEDPAVSGPVLEGGHAGFRLMGFSKWCSLGNLSVSPVRD